MSFRSRLFASAFVNTPPLAAVALALQRTRRHDAFADRRARLARLKGVEIAGPYGRHAALDVDPVEKRPGDAVLVFEYLALRASAFPRRVVVVAAGTWVHRGDEHEARREIDRRRRSRDGNVAVLKRLAQDLQRGARELRELVEEENPAVRERNLAGNGTRAAAEKPYRAHRVVRRTKWARGDEHAAALFAARDGVDLRDLKRLFGGHRREDGGYPPRDHRLARAGRANHQQIVPARNGDLDRLPYAFLAPDVGKVVASAFFGGDERGLNHLSARDAVGTSGVFTVIKKNR